MAYVMGSYVMAIFPGFADEYHEPYVTLDLTKDPP